MGNLRLVLADELQDGLFSYKAGEYNTAHKLLSPLAVNGNALAQLVLGVMCQEGQGVPQDYKEAVKWLELSANEGNASAQNLLGQIFEKGLGFSQDYLEAFKWYQLSANQG